MKISHCHCHREPKYIKKFRRMMKRKYWQMPYISRIVDKNSAIFCWRVESRVNRKKVYWIESEIRQIYLRNKASICYFFVCVCFFFSFDLKQKSWIWECLLLWYVFFMCSVIRWKTKSFEFHHYNFASQSKIFHIILEYQS